MDILRDPFIRRSSRMLGGLMIAWILAGARETRATQAPAASEAAATATRSRPTLASLAPSGRGLGARRAYLTLAPGIAGIALRPDYFPTGYLWGIDAGYHFPLGRAFKVQPGGFFEHSPTPRSNSEIRHWLRMGPQVRIGGGNDRVFGYALLALIVDLMVVVEPFGDTTRRRASPFAHPGLGAGVQGLLGKHVLLGGEGSLDMLVASPYLRLRLYVGLAF